MALGPCSGPNQQLSKRRKHGWCECDRRTAVRCHACSDSGTEVDLTQSAFQDRSIGVTGEGPVERPRQPRAMHGAVLIRRVARFWPLFLWSEGSGRPGRVKRAAPNSKAKEMTIAGLWPPLGEVAFGCIYIRSGAVWAHRLHGSRGPDCPCSPCGPNASDSPIKPHLYLL